MGCGTLLLSAGARSWGAALVQLLMRNDDGSENSGSQSPSKFARTYQPQLPSGRSSVLNSVAVMFSAIVSNVWPKSGVTTTSYDVALGVAVQSKVITPPVAKRSPGSGSRRLGSRVGQLVVKNW